MVEPAGRPGPTAAIRRMTAGAALALAAVTLAATVLVTTTGPVEPVAARSVA